MNDSQADPIGVGADGPGALPVYLTAFVGRHAELDELAGQLAGHRMITICGAGGLGKTRLAVEMARDAAGRFADGVVWVSLADVTDPATVDRTVAAAVLRHLVSGIDPITSLVAAIGSRRMLVVLDNCEQVARHCRTAVTTLVRSCPSLTVVTTSRIALHLQDEQVYSIPSLGVSSDTALVPDAVALFVDRASLGAPGWKTSASIDPVVDLICERLEGSPLAIELAASWIRVLSPQDLLTEITRGIDTLAVVGDMVIARHRSMQAVLETTWSWLGEHERDVLARLSVFVDGFSRQAAGVVAGATLGTLATLSERALIRRVPDGSGGTRYHVHQLVRVFAEHQLRAQHHWEGTDQQHYEYFAGLVGRAQSVWDTRDEPEALARIAADQSNVEAALTRAVDRRSANDALTLAGGLFAYWIYTAPLETRREILDRALALPAGESEDPAVRARALNVGAYAWLYADRRRAIDLFGQAVTLYRRAADRSGEAWSLRGLGYVHLVGGEPEVAARLNEESLRICRAVGDRSGLAWSLFDGAEAAVARRDLDRAAPLLTEALHAFVDLGIDYAAYRALVLLGDAHRLQRAWLPALEHYQRALDLQRGRGFTTRAPEIMEGLACLAVAVGREDLTARLHGAAEAWRSGLGTARLGYNEADFDQAHASAQRRLPSSRWRQLFEGGQRLTFTEAEVDTEKIVRDLTGWCRATPPAHLTRREIDVLRLVAEGISNHEIADRLFLSQRTVHAHLRSIFTKLGVSTRTAAAMRARELALGPPKK